VLIAKEENNGEVYLHSVGHTPLFNSNNELKDFIVYYRYGKILNPEAIQLNEEIYEEANFELVDKIPMKLESGATYNELVYKFIKHE
jgi:hypothetical protein